jgi:hypothetical protein
MLQSTQQYLGIPGMKGLAEQSSDILQKLLEGLQPKLLW